LFWAAAVSRHCLGDGLIAGLAELGIDLAAADVIIGTSARLGCRRRHSRRQELEALYQAQLAPPAPEPPPGWAGTSSAGCCGS